MEIVLVLPTFIPTRFEINGMRCSGDWNSASQNAGKFCCSHNRSHRVNSGALSRPKTMTEQHVNRGSQTLCGACRAAWHRFCNEPDKETAVVSGDFVLAFRARARVPRGALEGGHTGGTKASQRRSREQNSNKPTKHQDKSKQTKQAYENHQSSK